MDVSLTLAVPTFNRSRDAVRLAAQIAPWTEADGLAVSAVFDDDGSSDDTARSLERYRGPRLEVVRSDTNRGYARTLIRALSECDTEWVMLVADDDVFAPEPGHVEALMGWLAAERPDFVCTQWLTSDGGLYRGKDTTERITDADLRAAASHAPGLIYRCSAVRQALPLLDGSWNGIGRRARVPAGGAGGADACRRGQGDVLVALAGPGGFGLDVGNHGLQGPEVLECLVPPGTGLRLRQAVPDDGTGGA